MAESTIKLLVDASGAVAPLKRVTKETEKLEGATRDANGRLRDSKGKFIGVGQGAKGAAAGVKGLGVAIKGALLPLGLLVSAGAAITSVFKGFVEADKARGAVKTLGVNVQTLEMQLTGVVAKTKGLASVNQLLAASYDVASAGFSKAADISKILEASVLGASGGMTDIATVSDAATSVMNAYGLSTDKVSKIVDGFIQTQNDGKIVVGQYAGQIGRVAPIASAAGVGLDELNAAISTVTAQGVPVESTFAGIGQVMASILKPTSEAATTAKQLGLEFNTAAIKSKGFAGFLQDVVDKTGGSEVEITKLFGSVDALKALMPLISNDLKTFNKNLDNQQNSTGAAADAADIMGQTVSSQISRIVNSITTLVRGLDQVLGPAIKGILDLINTVITAAVTATAKLSEMFGMNRARAKARQELGGAQGGRKRFADPATEEAIEKRAKEIFQRSQAASTTQKDTPTVVDPTLQALLDQIKNGSSSNATSTGVSEADKARDLANLSRDRVQSLRDQASLAAALNEEEKRSVQLNIDLAEITRNANGFAIEDVNAQIAARIALDDKTLSAAEYNKTIEDGAKAAKTAADAQQKAADDLKEKYKQVGDSIKSNVTDSIVAAIEGTKSLGESAMDILKNLANQLLRSGINQLFNVAGTMGPSGGILSMLFGGGKASGGTVKSGTSYMVGERGPELFSPGRSGSIAPNGAMGGVNVGTINITVENTGEQLNPAAQKQLAGQVQGIVLSTLANERRSGGML